MRRTLFVIALAVLLCSVVALPAYGDSGSVSCVGEWFGDLVEYLVGLFDAGETGPGQATPEASSPPDGPDGDDELHGFIDPYG